MNTFKRSVACTLVGGLSVVALGCGNEEKSAEAPKPMVPAPTTKPAMKESTTPAVATPPAPAATMKESDLTHMITMDNCPVYESMPTDTTAKPAMMAKKGDKVLVMVPRGKFTQITTVGGVKGYVPTAALKPLGN